MTNFERIKELDEEGMAFCIADLMASFMEAVGIEVDEDTYFETISTVNEFLTNDYIKPSEYMS